MKTSILIITALAISCGFTACATSAHEATTASLKMSRTAALSLEPDRSFNPQTGNWDFATNE